VLLLAVRCAASCHCNWVGALRRRHWHTLLLLLL
jgi:hypothetical protein